MVDQDIDRPLIDPLIDMQARNPYKVYIRVPVATDEDLTVHSFFCALQCQCGLTAAPDGGKHGRRSSRPAARAKTQVQGTRHHLPRRGRRTCFIQEKQDTERQIQEPPTERQRRLTQTQTNFTPERSRIKSFKELS